MSFLTTQPEELAAAAGQLGVIGSAFAAQNGAAAAPTTAVIPAAADEVSMLQASLFTAYGTLYQQVSAEATTMYEMFVKTLGTSAGTYAATEAANSSAAGSTLSGGTAAAAAPAASGPIADIANLINIGVGNDAAAASNFLGLANGGLLLPPESSGPAGAALESFETTSVGAPATSGVGAAAPTAGMGVAAPLGAMSAPPSWAAPATLVSRVSGTAGSAGASWAAAAPQAVPGSVLAGMPGYAAIGRNSAGFGAPRYGVKPLIMPKPTAV